MYGFYSLFPLQNFILQECDLDQFLRRYIKRVSDVEERFHEADLLALIDEEEPAEKTCVCTVHCEVGAINTSCPICKASMVDCMGKTPVAEKEPEPAAPAEPEPEPEATQEETKKNSALLLLVLLVLLGGGFALYWFKFRKPKANTKGPVDLDDYDFGEENEEKDAEYETEDDTSNE